MKLLCAIVFVAACTYDLHLGARDSGTATCDPLDGDDCACTDTSQCPRGFYCLPANNQSNHCVVVDGCSVVQQIVNCPNSACSPTTDQFCNVAPACNANVCANNGEACCASDFHCYPTTCIGCCK